MSGASALRLGMAAASLIALMMVGATAETRSPVADDGRLRIVSWDLADGIAAGAVTTPEIRTAAEPAWRHTFGAERRIPETARTFDVERLKADVVLLQGVTSVRETRRLFPARDWKLILARDMLSPDSDLVGEVGRLPNGRPASAVAVRYQRSLRATAVEHPLEVKPDAAVAALRTVDTATVVPLDAPSAPKGDAAALAVRLSYQGSFIWVVAASLPADCKDDCAPARALATFMSRQPGLPVIVGGKLVRARIGKQLASCNDQSLSAPVEVAEALAAKASSDTPAGCVVFVDM